MLAVLVAVVPFSCTVPFTDKAKLTVDGLPPPVDFVVPRHPPSAARHMVALASNKPAALRRRLPAPANIKPRSSKPVVLMNAIVRGRPLCVCTELN